MSILAEPSCAIATYADAQANHAELRIQGTNTTQCKPWQFNPWYEFDAEPSWYITGRADFTGCEVWIDNDMVWDWHRPAPVPIKDANLTLQFHWRPRLEGTVTTPVVWRRA